MSAIKTVTMYEIREYKGSSEYSKSMSSKLRTRERACKLVKRLKKMGHDAFLAKFRINA